MNLISFLILIFKKNTCYKLINNYLVLITIKFLQKIVTKRAALLLERLMILIQKAISDLNLIRKNNRKIFQNSADVYDVTEIGSNLHGHDKMVIVT